MKRILPPIFMLMMVVVIAFATPIDAQKEQQVEPITTALHTERTFETVPAAEPKAAAVDDRLLTSPSGLDADLLTEFLKNNVGLFYDAEADKQLDEEETNAVIEESEVEVSKNEYVLLDLSGYRDSRQSAAPFLEHAEMRPALEGTAARQRNLGGWV